MDVSDRRLQVQLTQEAKIASTSSFIGAIFAFAGFVSALGRPPYSGQPLTIDKPLHLCVNAGDKIQECTP